MTRFIDCPVCKGSGELVANPGWPDPQTEVSGDCWRCDGFGGLHPDGSVVQAADRVVDVAAQGARS